MKQNRTHFLNNSTTTDRSRNKVARAKIPLLTKPMQRPTLSLQTPPAIIESCFKKKKNPGSNANIRKVPFSTKQDRDGDKQTEHRNTNKSKTHKQTQKTEMRPTKDAPDLVKSGELQTNPGELVDLSDFSGSLLDGSHGNRNGSGRKARELRSDGELYKRANSVQQQNEHKSNEGKARQ